MRDNDDFAAAAMLRLIRLGLQREGLPLPPQPPPAARVPLDGKRALLQSLMQQHGPALLLRLGQAVIDAPDEPALAALLPATDPPDLVARWQRLERYIHSRHRVATIGSAPGRLVLLHRSLREGEPPLPAEDLLVWGVLIGLLKRLGTPGLRAEVAPGDSARLTLTWQPAPAREAPAAPPTGDTLTQVRALLSADCAAPWSLDRLATALGLSRRTLQRRLAEAGSSFSSLWTEVRLAASARRLTDADTSTAQIGFECGFADQAHFTRCFHRHTALTPARWRREFARAG
jgi:AraC-like DNA-binding protein